MPQICSDRRPFAGFEHLDANYIYCPNQFFEVCLRHHSRGVVRLVAYMLRQTLGYLDRDGNPVRQDIRVPYSALSKHAGVSARAIPSALADAVAGGFMVCVTPGVANSRGQRGQAAEYRLRWGSEEDSYTDDPIQFSGFYAGEGNRSPIPNGFFDLVVRHETLAMAKVVGTILRHTAGYQNQFGGRRSDAPLSFSYLQKFANLKDRKTLSETLKSATKRGFIHRVSAGYFDPNAGRQSEAARYAVKWLHEATNNTITAKTLPDQGHGKNPTGMTAETPPDDHGKNPTARKTTHKDTNKQQDATVAESIRRLQKQGFDLPGAKRLATVHSAERIVQQIEWLEFRNPDKNRLGMLRRAIEEDWSQPIQAKQREKTQCIRERQKQENFRQAEAEAEAVERKRHRREQRQELQTRWKKLTTEEKHHLRGVAEQRANSDFLRRRLRARRDLDNPPLAVLLEMERERLARK